MEQILTREIILQRTKNWLVDYAFPLKVFFISRSGLFLLVYLSQIFLPLMAGFWRVHPENLLLDGWSRFDYGWYGAIAKHGYTNIVVDGVGQDTAFLPLYPILIRMFNAIFHDYLISGIVVSNIAFLLALIVLYKLLTAKYGLAIAERTVTLISFGAFSFFFSAAYTESLFLLAAACAFYFAERKRYFWAACWVAVAGATRVIGALIIFPLFILYLENIAYDWRRIRPNVLVLLIGFIGIFAYMLFLFTNYDNPLQFITSQGAWGFTNPLTVIVNSLNIRTLTGRSLLTGSYPALTWIHVLILLASIVLVVAYAKRVGWSYTLFSIIGILASLSRPNGIGRYLIVLFPLFICLAFFLKNRDLYHLFLYFSILLLALFSLMYSHWYWVA